MHTVSVSSLLVAAASVPFAAAAGLKGLNYSPIFPDTTYPDAISKDPVVIAGSQSFQKSPPSYPSPWGDGSGDWGSAYEKAQAFVSQLTLEEKVNLTTGNGWEMGRCVGESGSVPRLGFRGLCLQDSPV